MCRWAVARGQRSRRAPGRWGLVWRAVTQPAGGGQVRYRFEGYSERCTYLLTYFSGVEVSVGPGTFLQNISVISS